MTHIIKQLFLTKMIRYFYKILIYAHCILKKNWSSSIKIFYRYRESKFANISIKIAQKIQCYLQCISCIVFKIMILARQEFKIAVYSRRRKERMKNWKSV